MQRIKTFSLILFWALSSCVPYPNDFAPTRERKPDVWVSAKGLSSGFRMADPNAGSHFLHGVDAARFDDVYRQIAPRAAFRLAASKARQLRLEYQSALPQQVNVKVNGVSLGGFITDASGSWRGAVPPDGLVAGAVALVEISSEGGLGLAMLALE